jgi:lipopolysaccharide biosynthesis regulator YciM
MNKRKLWAILSMMTVATVAVHAQSGGVRDRLKAEKCYSADGKVVDCEAQAKAAAASAAAAVTKYPNATRVEPVMPKTKIKKEWDAMVKASNSKDPAALALAADAVLANAEASNEEKSEAYFQKYISQIQRDPTNYAEMSRLAEAGVKQGGLNNNKHYDLMRNLGLLKINDKQYAQALDYLNRFSAETGINDDLQVLKNKGNANYRLGKYPEAIAVLKTVYAQDKGADPNVAVMLMDAYNKTGQKAEATRIADEVAKSASTAAASGDNSGQLKQLLVLANAKQYEKAAKIFDELFAKGQIKQLNEYEAGYISYSYLEGKEAKAITIIKDGMAKGIITPDVTVYNVLGQSYYYSNEPKAAADAWSKAAAMSSKGDYDLLLARVLAEESDYAQAKAAAQKALSKGIPSRGEAYLIIAESESEFGLDNKVAMLAALREAMKDPETQDRASKMMKNAGLK